MVMRQYEIEQEFDTVESNALMIDTDVARQVIAALNQHLASLYALHHQYHKHQWVVEGPQFRELEQLFSMHAEQVELAAVEIGERVNALGGVPAATMRKQVELSYLQEEPDGILGIRDMLARDVEAERTIATKLREHIRLVTDLGEYGTEDLLKQTLQDTEKRAAFVQKHLERESLDRGLVGSQPDARKVDATIDKQ
ncbi:MAG TPA: DNA starvation/stationary phase protection protein [Herpetosiphonaceae bacterium]